MPDFQLNACARIHICVYIMIKQVFFINLSKYLEIFLLYDKMNI